MASCGQMPANLLEMLASTIMKDANGDIFFNYVAYTGTGLDHALTCGLQGVDLEDFIVSNGFGVDANGKPAIKIGHTT
jgi:hypothetical protein